MSTARITSKGQVTIPADVRRALNAEEGDDLSFTVTGDGEAYVRVIKRVRLTDLYGSLPATRPFPGTAEVRAETRRAVAGKVLRHDAQRK